MIDPKEIETYFDRLWPLHRSITGEGLRQTIAVLGQIVPVAEIELPTGLELPGGWVIPKEWTPRMAYVVDPNGTRRFDIKENRLHLLNYSMPFQGRVTRPELDDHLYSNKELAHAIPYVTSYYKERWGFCVSHAERAALPEGNYEVVIDTSLTRGFLTIGEYTIEGQSREEVFFSSFVCHPMMANNELAGPLVQAFLARELAKRKLLRYSYRFAWHPETIGSIAYLHQRGAELKERMVAGFGFCCVGDGRGIVYKRSRRGDTLADRVAALLLRDCEWKTEIRPFKPFDGDERQYCSPGFDLPYGCFMHTPPGEYSEYHTSADDKSMLDFGRMAEFVVIMLQCVDMIETNRCYTRTDPRCEPKLDQHGLWSDIGVGTGKYKELQYALLWLLNYADGRDLLAIAEISGQPVALLAEAAQRCVAAGLVRETK